MGNKILILDDEERMAQLISRSLEREGYVVAAVTEPEQAIEALKEDSWDVLLTDLRMPGMTGIDILKRSKSISPQTEVILMTAYASVETTREALKAGAVDYLIKPISAENDLKPLLEKLLSTEKESPSSEQVVAQNLSSKGNQKNLSRTAPLADHGQMPDSILSSKSPAMMKIYEKLEKIARADASVLLRGESGTGKEVTADLIQMKSPRAKQPYLKINCGALSETLLDSELFGHVKGSFTGAVVDRDGMFASSDGGTLMLDEIGEISPALQVKLLRVLQSGEYSPVGSSVVKKCNVRIIAATNRDLEAMIETGEFRQDLYYRLNVVPLFLPPLRDRREDLRTFINHFVEEFAPHGVNPTDVKFTDQAIKAMEEYRWPGNVRELENAIEHALVLGDHRKIDVDDLPYAIQRDSQEDSLVASSAGEASLEEIEKKCLVQALEKTGGNQTRAAKILGITRRTLGYRIKKYGLEEKLAELTGRPIHE